MAFRFLPFFSFDSFPSLFLLQLVAFYQACFQFKNFRDRKFLRWTRMEWNGEILFAVFTKILKDFDTYFKLHQPNDTDLDITGKISSCFTI